MSAYRLNHRKFTRLRHNEDGITAIEFAFVAPILMLMLMGVIELSLVMFTSAVMESATGNTARLGKTGYVAVGSTRAQQILSNVKARTAGLLDPQRLVLTTKVYDAFDRVGEPEPCISPSNPPCNGTPGTNFQDINGNGQWDADMAQTGQGSAGDVVVYEVSYPWPVFTPGVRQFLGSTITVRARTVVKNEPFSGGITR